VRELWAVVGRRGGKDSVASAVACFASGFIDYKKVLRPGERASVLCLAVDKAQASIVEKYTRAYFADVPLLRGQVTRETADGLLLKTGAELDVLASNFRNVRGRSIACVVMDEVAFWRSELLFGAAKRPPIPMSKPIRRWFLLWRPSPARC
jgi:phage terminase large subunit-like protein